MIRVLAGLLIVPAGLWAVSSIWDLAHWDTPWLQTRALLRRVRRWWR